MTLPEPLQQVDRTWVQWRGQTLAYFAGCDYFRMASHPQVLAAAQEAISKYGLNVAASRRTTGNHALYHQLEMALEDFFGERALLVSNGYLTNLIVLQALADRFSCLMIDETSHGSLIDAARAAGLPFQTFRSVNELVERRPDNRVLVLTDGVSAFDGSIAPLGEYHRSLPMECLLLVDDSHGAGVLGATGKGTHELLNVPRSRLIQTTTLSKAFGAFGGAIIAPDDICDLIIQKSHAFGGSTPFPLPCAAAALEAVNLLKRNEFRERLRENCAQVRADATAILAVNPKSHERFSRVLLERGIFPPHIRYQHIPEEGYFRFAISSEHTRAQLDALADALADALTEAT